MRTISNRRSFLLDFLASFIVLRVVPKTPSEMPAARPLPLNIQERIGIQLREIYADMTSLATRSATVGMPNGRVPPSAFGMSTRLTGGGK
jgi:hypothetical protein